MTRIPDQAGLFGNDSSVERTTKADARALTLPFGKFKGEPVDLLLAHADYALWLLTAKAAMLRRSHSPLYHWLISHFGAPDTTPEHNRLQNRFLDEDFCLQLYLHLNPGLADKPRLYTTSSAFIEGWKHILPSRVSWAHSCGVDEVRHGSSLSKEERASRIRQKSLANLQRDVEKVILSSLLMKDDGDEERRKFPSRSAEGPQNVWRPVFQAVGVKFEVDGADVQFQAGGGLGLYVDENRSSYGQQLQTDLLRFAERKHYRVEVKPFVGDDYPVILRSMTTKQCNVLLAEAFEADGASWEQVKKVFGSRGIQVALLDEVLVTPIPEHARALTLPDIDKAEMLRLATLGYDEHVAKVDVAKAKAMAGFGDDF